MDPKEISQKFLFAAQAMADSMLEQIKQRDPEAGERMAAAVADGAGLSVAYTFSAQPAIELLLRIGDNTLPLAAVPLDFFAGVTKTH